MSDIEQKAHDLAVALVSSYTTGKYADEAARLNEYGLEFDMNDCDFFFKIYSAAYEQFKEMFSSNTH